MAKRRIKFDWQTVQDSILYVLHDQFTARNYRFMGLGDIEAKQKFPHNAIALAINNLKGKGLIESNGHSIAAPLLYQVNHRFLNLTEYALTSSGVDYDNEWTDQYYDHVGKSLGYAILDGDSDDSEKKIDDDKADVWQPLPVDRADPETAETIERIEEALIAIRQDNGYSENFPEERDYVVQNLGLAVDWLRSERAIIILKTRTWILEPLSQAARRFGPSAVGLIVTTARELFAAWQKKKLLGG
ncbi:MAG: hypothetical protein GC184_05480 [Rhizobiales bacterium]|nr:hypothetical protein [Hyphomicrobiales bacterium]